MPDEDGLAPLDAQIVSAKESRDLSAIADSMQELLQAAVLGLQLQKADVAEEAARKADAQFALGKAKGPSTELLLLEVLRHMVCLFAPLARGLVFQVEGRFTKAQEQINKGLEICNQGLKAIDEYAAQPDCEAEAVEALRPMFTVFPVLLRGTEAYIRADMVGYQGKVAEYLTLLRAAIAEFQKVNDLPPSANPVFQMLAGLCAAQAGRLETRAEWFELRPSQNGRRLDVLGKKIFIIHGHDEAKWRELRDLLEDEFQQETVVLEEEVDAGTSVMQKFEKSADECCYACALLTPDDIVGKGKKSYAQARPNVLFELGWFYGRFGPERVCIVKKKGTQIPSDLAGILYMEFTERVSEVEGRIRKELKRIGAV